jgi:hypothetical protein
MLPIPRKNDPDFRSDPIAGVCLFLPIVLSFKNLNHLHVDVSVCRQYFSSERTELPTVKVRNAASCLENDQASCRHIPRLELQFPETVKAAAGHVAEIEGRRAASPDSLSPGDKIDKMADIIDTAFPQIIGKSRGQKTFIQFRYRRRFYFPSVQEGSAASFSGEQFLPHGIKDDSEDNLSSVDKSDGHAENRIIVGKIGRTVDWIDDPKII